LKAAADAGLQTDWYTYYAGGAGGPTAVKQTGLSDRVFEIVEGIPNAAPEAAQAFETAFRAKTGVGLWYPRVVNEMHMLATAIKQAKADDAKSIAAQLEGMKVQAFDGGDAWMRKDDHQFFQDIYIASLGPLEPGAKFDEEGTGWGWKSVAVVKAADTVLPTTCKMDRP
jgi:branched-chain amino acid transport system substrate-binding protein